MKLSDFCHCNLLPVLLGESSNFVCCWCVWCLSAWRGCQDCWRTTTISAHICVCVCVCFVWVCKLSSVIDYDWMLCMNRKNVSRLAVQCSVRLANQSDRLVRLGQPGWCIANVQSVNFDLYIYRGSSARERASAIINHKSFMIQLNSNEMENRLYFKQKNKEKNV